MPVADDVEDTAFNQFAGLAFLFRRNMLDSRRRTCVFDMYGQIVRVDSICGKAHLPVAEIADLHRSVHKEPDTGRGTAVEGGIIGRGQYAVSIDTYRSQNGIIVVGAVDGVRTCRNHDILINRIVEDIEQHFVTAIGFLGGKEYKTLCLAVVL